MIIKKVLTAGGIRVIGTCIVHGFASNRMYYEIIIADNTNPKFLC